MVASRYAIPVLWSAGLLIGLAIVAADLLVAYLIFRGYRAGLIAQGPEEIAAVDTYLSLTLRNPVFWLVVGGFNAISIWAVAFVFHQLRRLRARPGNNGA